MGESLRALLNRPLTVGSKTLATRLTLAPMARLGNIAFRELVSRYGGYGLLFTEMAAAKSLPSSMGHFDGLMWGEGEPPRLVCQLFGHEPDLMARAAERLEAEGFFGVDINFGCSTTAICKKGCGAALLREPARAAAVVRAVRAAVTIPLFVKFRTGWKDDPHAAADMARRFEGAGADALTFHPRVAPDVRTRPPRWGHIGIVKEAVGIPVFGNGDVFHEEDCLRMLGTTGCDGVALGRIALARPWVFAQWSDGFRPPPEIYGACAVSLVQLMVRYFGERAALRRFHRFSRYYGANFRFGHTLHSRGELV